MDYILSVVTLAAINMIAVLGLSIFTGFTGLFSFGHAAFVGVGAYASAILTYYYYVPFFVALVAGAFAAAAVSLIIGVPTLRANVPPCPPETTTSDGSLTTVMSASLTAYPIRKENGPDGLMLIRTSYMSSSRSIRHRCSQRKRSSRRPPRPPIRKPPQRKRGTSPRVIVRSIPISFSASCPTG